MYIPCIPCIFFDSEMSFATVEFTFTNAINSSCFDFFPAMQCVFCSIVTAFGADMVTSWNISEPQEFSSDIPEQIMFDFTMLFVTEFIATKPIN
jgi:hypothetical protein